MRTSASSIYSLLDVQKGVIVQSCFAYETLFVYLFIYSIFWTFSFPGVDPTMPGSKNVQKKKNEYINKDLKVPYGSDLVDFVN